MAQPDHDERVRGFWSAGVGVYIMWNAFTLLGALAGNALGDPKLWGLDGAAVAAFLGLLWPRLTDKDPIAIAIIGRSPRSRWCPRPARHPGARRRRRDRGGLGVAPLSDVRERDDSDRLVLLAAFTAYAIKVSGYLLPQAWLDRPPITELAGTLTVGLLASLTSLNTVANGQALVLDARLLSLVAGAIAPSLQRGLTTWSSCRSCPPTRSVGGSAGLDRLRVWPRGGRLRLAQLNDVPARPSAAPLVW